MVLLRSSPSADPEALERASADRRRATTAERDAPRRSASCSRRYRERLTLKEGQGEGGEIVQRASQGGWKARARVQGARAAILGRPRGAARSRQQRRRPLRALANPQRGRRAEVIATEEGQSARRSRSRQKRLVEEALSELDSPSITSGEARQRDGRAREVYARLAVRGRSASRAGLDECVSSRAS